MSDFHEETIIQLVDRHSQAAMLGDSDAAQASLHEARELDPATLEIELAKRAFLSELGTPEEISERRQRVVARLGGVAVAAPDRIEAWRLLAEMLGRLHNYEGVLRATASGLKREPNHVALWVMRSTAQIELQQFDSAARSLRHCVKIAPTNNQVESLVRHHPACRACYSLFPSVEAKECTMCGALGPGAGGKVASVRMRSHSKFDLYFPRVRQVVADALQMPARIVNLMTLDTLLKRHFKRTNQQCALVLRAMSREFGASFDAELFRSAVVGYLDLLIADLIRAIKAEDGVIEETDTGIRVPVKRKPSSA